MERINTCTAKDITGQSLGSIINPQLKDIAKTQVMEAISEYPIEALMTGDVRSGDRTPLDKLEEYLSEQTEIMIKYSLKPDANQNYLKNELRRIAIAEEALETLRKSKTEVWLYIYSCIRAAEKQFGIAGNISINFPLRFDNNETIILDFINQKAMVWKKQ